MKRLCLVALICCSARSASAQDDWFGPDKTLHFAVCTGVSGGTYALSALVLEDRTWRFVTGAGAAIALGAAKEAADATGSGTPSWRDFTWDVAGALTGSLTAYLIDRFLIGEPHLQERSLAVVDEPMRRAIKTHEAPEAIGPYSQAIAVVPGEMLFLSGQIGLDPKTQALVPGGIEAETRRVIANLRAVLAAEHLGPEHVVKTTIFLADLADFTTVNAIYGETFNHAPPARATVQVAALPKGARVEIEAIAIRPAQH